jgi:DMSO/TMAO reductase YedYZ molybdopterin-dependent catalytic subunit
MTIAMLTLVALAAAPEAGTPALLKVEGDLVKGRSLTLKDLQSMGPVTSDWTDKSGVHKVTGIRLDTLLARLDFSEGAMGPQMNPKEKHRGLRGAVIVTADDGFEAVFSVGELLESVGATNALLIWEMDGKPLSAQVGPLRIAVTTDKNMSRSVHQVTGMRVVSLAKK